jgi:tetratricopeptide (TPR) repeat protein
VPFWTRAGEQATRKSANREAVSHITSGLAALRALPDDTARARCELELQLALGTPLIAVSGYTGAATVQAYARARELAERLADRDSLFQALYGVWVNHMIRGQLDEAYAIAGQLVSLAQRSESSAQEVTARRVLGFCLALQGDLEEGQRQLEAALGLFRGDEHGRLFLRFGQDPRIAAISVLAWIACLRGDRKESNRLAAKAISDAHALGHSYTTAYATYIAGAAPSFLMKDTPATLLYLDALTELSTEGDFPFWKGIGLGLRASFTAREGRISEAQALSSESFVILDAMSVYWFRPFIFAGLAEGFLHGGDATAASHYVDVAISTMEQTGERWIEPHLSQLTLEVAQGGKPPFGVQ